MRRADRAAARSRRRPVVAGSGRSTNGAASLSVVHGQAAQVGEVGVAGAEVVDGDPHAHVGERAQRRERRRGRRPSASLSVSSSCSSSAGQPGLGQDVGDVVDDAGLADLPGGQVDADEQQRLGVAAAPGRGLAAGLGEHPAAERHDQPGLLGERDEPVRPEPLPGRAGSSGPAPRRPITAGRPAGPAAGTRPRTRPRPAPRASGRRARTGRRRAGGGRRRTARTGRGRPSWPSTAWCRRPSSARPRLGADGRRARTTPALADTTTRCPPSATGCATAASARRGDARAECGPVVGGRSTSTTNSSPPIAGHQVPVGAERGRSRSATARSSSSPMSWPRVSLTPLNPSRSR